MKFIRKGGRVIPIGEGGSSSGKKKSGIKKPTLAHEQAKNHGLKVGVVSSFLLTPAIGIPVGYMAYKSWDKKK